MLYCGETASWPDYVLSLSLAAASLFPEDIMQNMISTIIGFVLLGGAVVLAGYPSAHRFHPQAPRSHYHKKVQPYAFDYKVRDHYRHLQHDRSEKQDDLGQVKGSYRVLLPDGRMQVVTYTADHHGGYRADVVYEGQTRPHHHPAPHYKHTPAHHPSPSQGMAHNDIQARHSLRKTSPVHHPALQHHRQTQYQHRPHVQHQHPSLTRPQGPGPYRRHYVPASQVSSASGHDMKPGHHEEMHEYVEEELVMPQVAVDPVVEMDEGSGDMDDM